LLYELIAVPSLKTSVAASPQGQWVDPQWVTSIHGSCGNVVAPPSAALSQS